MGVLVISCVVQSPSVRRLRAAHMIRLAAKAGHHLLASSRLGGAARSCWTRRGETTSYLRDAFADREIYLIGTAHVSQSSADEVRELSEPGEIRTSLPTA